MLRKRDFLTCVLEVPLEITYGLRVVSSFSEGFCQISREAKFTLQL